MEALDDFVRPSVTVDTVVFTVDPDRPELCVALVDTGNQRALPGTFLHDNETLQQAAVRALEKKVGIRGVTPVQLHVFDALGRDPRGWIISVAHMAVARVQQLGGVKLTPVAEATNLIYDHGDMLAKAVAKLRADYAEAPDPWHVLDTFTLRELRTVHEAIDPDTPLRDTFRRQMQPLLVDTGELSSGSVGKPSRVWRRETEPERILRKFGKQERPVSQPNYSTSSASRSRSQRGLNFGNRLEKAEMTSAPPRSDREYAIEIEWMNGRITRDENLSPTQAGLRLSELREEMRRSWESLPFDARPLRARIVTPWGDTEQSIEFGADVG